MKRPSLVVGAARVVKGRVLLLLDQMRSGASPRKGRLSLKFSTVSKPAKPLTLVPTSTLCQAARTARYWPRFAQRVRNAASSEAGAPSASSQRPSKASGQVFGVAPRVEARLLQGVLVGHHITMEDELKGTRALSPLAVE